MNFPQQRKCGHTYSDIYTFIESTLCPNKQNETHIIRLTVSYKIGALWIKSPIFPDFEQSTAPEGNLVTWYKFDYLEKKALSKLNIELGYGSRGSRVGLFRKIILHHK